MPQSLYTLLLSYYYVTTSMLNIPPISPLVHFLPPSFFPFSLLSFSLFLPSLCPSSPPSPHYSHSPARVLSSCSAPGCHQGQGEPGASLLPPGLSLLSSARPGVRQRQSVLLPRLSHTPRVIIQCHVISPVLAKTLATNCHSTSCIYTVHQILYHI